MFACIISSRYIKEKGSQANVLSKLCVVASLQFEVSAKASSSINYQLSEAKIKGLWRYF